jgi:hypothetical protein
MRPSLDVFDCVGAGGGDVLRELTRRVVATNRAA